MVMRVALGVEADRLFAVELELHRALRHAREQRRLRLDRHVFLAAEGAAVRDQLDDEVAPPASPRTRRDLAAVVEDALALRVEMQAGRRAAEPASARLRLEEEVLDALRPPGAGDDVRARRRAPRRRRRGDVSRTESTLSCFGLTCGAPG